MNYKAHRNYGATTALIVIIVSAIATKSVEASLFCGLITLIFSLFPDLDTHSTPSKIFATIILACNAGILLLDLFFKLDVAALFVLSFIACNVFIGFKTLTHRGVTHKYIWPFLSLVAGVFFIETIGVYFISASVGLCTHFACDSISPLKLRNWI